MYYLLYQKDGLIKKHSLDKAEIRIGRGRDNDIVLKDKAVSKKHCRVRVDRDELTVTDLDSRNGTFVDGASVNEARLGLNNSFCIAQTQFFFKQGDIGEFAVSPSLAVLYALPNACRRVDLDKEPETDPVNNRLEQALRSLAEKSLVADSPDLFFRQAGAVLAHALTSGTLVFIDSAPPRLLVNHLQFRRDDFREVDFRALPAETNLPIQGRTLPAWTFRSQLPEADHFLCYLNPASKRSEWPPPLFFRQLLEIIEVHFKLTAGRDLNWESGSVLYQDDQATIIGESRELRIVVDQARRFAARDSFIMILGESGTGKELFARMIHGLSQRKSYVALNCAAIPASLLESELFGYEKGAFTDARERRIGKIEASSGGTLVLDEIGDMPLDIQAKVLRVIQERTVTRLGGHESVPVDLRILALSNQDLSGLAEAGKFRRDLYFRLLVHQLTIPPLRQRKQDIPALVRHFAGRYAGLNAVVPAGFSNAAEESLIRHSWPGNVRELENEIRRIMETVDDGEVIGRHHLRPEILRASTGAPLPDAAAPSSNSPDSLKERIRRWERNEIEDLLRKNGGNKSQTARDMGITYRGLLLKIKRLGLF